MRVRVIGQNSAEVVAAVREGELEAGMIALPIDDRGLDVQPIMRDELVYVSADPVRLDVPGAAPSQVFYLRSYADSRAIVARTAGAKRALVVGASFIGLEVAASLRARKLEVHVVAPEKRPLERVFGPDMGDFVCKLHEEHGVIFHLEDTSVAIDRKQVK